MDTQASPLSPSIIPSLAILPQPLAADRLPCGQLVSRASKHTAAALEDRDFDDLGTQWYKDVIIFESNTGHFTESLGGTHLLQKPLAKGFEAGTIEADEQHVRLLKNADEALQKIWRDEEAKAWIKQQQDEAGLVVAHRQVSNASYKRAALVDAGNGDWEVVRELSGGDPAAKRRDSGLPVETHSKWDVVGVLVRKIVVEGDAVRLGEELGAAYWR